MSGSDCVLPYLSVADSADEIEVRLHLVLLARNYSALMDYCLAQGLKPPLGVVSPEQVREVLARGVLDQAD